MNGDRVPPNEPAAERAVLGAVFIDNRAWDDVDGALDPADFYREAHRRIFEAMRQLGAGAALDVLTIGDHLRTSGHLAAVGGLAYLNSLLDAVPTSSNAAHYARIVRQKSMLRRAIGVAIETIAAAYAEPEDAEEFVAGVERRFGEIVDGAPAAHGLRPMAAVVHEAFGRIESALAVSLVLVLFSIVVLVLLRLFLRWGAVS